MVLGEVILSAFLTVLFEKLASGELLNFACRMNIQTHLNKWNNMLSIIQAVLIDAEEKQITNTAVKKWFDHLDDLVYDLDDIVDELATEAAKRSREESEAGSTSTTSKVWKLIPTCCTSFTPTVVMFDREMDSKISEITTRLEDIAEQTKYLHLTQNLVVRRPQGTTERLPTTSLVDESRVHGREADTAAVINLLIRDDTRDDHDEVICVIPIVGMGGIGKTTIAQLVYNDEQVNDRFDFDVKAWVCVSEDFDVLKITKTIFESVTEESCDFKELDKLQVKLREELYKKKFLLVLDDIWNEDYDKWDLLLCPFQVVSPGSRIIVTTRSQSIARTMGSVPAYRVMLLKDDDCLSILAQHALRRRNFNAHLQLKEIGMGIVKKCKGLPLAAKTLGGLLRAKPTLKEWEDVLNSKLWNIPEEQCGILPALRLSYYHLPAHLKNLFAYCSIFPKTCPFSKLGLISLWISEGLLPQQSKERKQTMEEFGNECFNELLSRSLFEQSSTDRSRCVMHDLINDLAQNIAGEKCFRLEGVNGQSKIPQRARHLSIICQQHETYGRLNVLTDAQSLRTFVAFPMHVRKNYLPDRVLVDLLPKLRCLRVLAMDGYYIRELPESVGNLKHLRLLDLSRTAITCLPESVCDLYNLKELRLNQCKDLYKLPSSIWNLVNLVHLDNYDTVRLQGMPPGIGKLTSLQKLSKFIVHKNGGLRLRELKDLSLLQGYLLIFGLQNVMDVEDAKEANLIGKKHLDDITLVWSEEFDDYRNEILEMDVLDELRPHKKLKFLRIDFYGGIKFPSWMGDPSFSNIVKIRLVGCKKCTSLPPLGQLSMLEEVHIQGMHKLKRVGIEFYGGDGCSSALGFIPFPSLKILSFVDMPEWEEWSCLIGSEEVAEKFGRLYDLSIVRCPKLVVVPVLRLPYLYRLMLQGCCEVVLRSLADLSSLNSLIIDDVTGLHCCLTEEMHLSKALGNVKVFNCRELVTLWENGVTPQNLVGLWNLVVSNCGNLKSLPSRLLEPLLHLHIEKCPKLVSFTGTTEMSKLITLTIKDCIGLASLPTGKLPTTLKRLEIYGRTQLESISETMLQDCSVSLEVFNISHSLNMKTLLGTINNFASLVQLDLFHCDDMECFPERGLPTPNLRNLSIGSCQNLKYFVDGIRSLACLNHLVVKDCPRLESFPEINLPSNLKSLLIERCKNLKPLSEWGLHGLTSLQGFRIEGGFSDMVIFPPDDMCLLPPTLIFLFLRNLRNLESLSKGLQNLTSLQGMVIADCPKLQVLLNKDQLAKLSFLQISGCPLLKQRCLKDKGDYWPAISFIPHVKIDEPSSE